MGIQTSIRGVVQKIIRTEKNVELIIDKVPVKFWGQTLGSANDVNEGDFVVIDVVVKGREWKEKFYAQVEANSSWTGRSPIREYMTKDEYETRIGKKK